VAKAPSSSTKSRSRKGNEGYNVATGEYVDLVKAGVVDPTKVTRSALQNAASISGLLLTTECVITELPGEGAVALAKGAKAAIIDGLRPMPHPSHMSIDEAVEAGRGLGAGKVWLTHLTHLTEHAQAEASLPQGFGLAYDGLRLLL
jgi:hypothetical protein